MEENLKKLIPYATYGFIVGIVSIYLDLSLITTYSVSIGGSLLLLAIERIFWR